MSDVVQIGNECGLGSEQGASLYDKDGDDAADSESGAKHNKKILSASSQVGNGKEGAEGRNKVGKRGTKKKRSGRA